MSGDSYTYQRRSIDGRGLIDVVNHWPGTMSRHEPRVRFLAGGGLTDPQIGEALGLTAKQVHGIRQRAEPYIPSGRKPGRPKGVKDSVPRRRPGDWA